MKYRVPKNDYDNTKIESIKAWKNFFESNYSYIINNFILDYYQVQSVLNVIILQKIMNQHQQSH